jgi:hypothetical protein
MRDPSPSLTVWHAGSCSLGVSSFSFALASASKMFEVQQSSPLRSWRREGG